jgi:hypothetical protein
MSGSGMARRTGRWPRWVARRRLPLRLRSVRHREADRRSLPTTLRSPGRHGPNLPGQWCSKVELRWHIRSTNRAPGNGGQGTQDGILAARQDLLSCFRVADDLILDAIGVERSGGLVHNRHG